MKKSENIPPQKDLKHLTHLYFSEMDQSQAATRKKPDQEAPWFLRSRVCKLLTSNGDFFKEARIVDQDVSEPEGVDLILAKECGHPVFCEILDSGIEVLPFRVFRDIQWLKSKKELFLRTYQPDGITGVDSLFHIFFAPVFSKQAVETVRQMGEDKITLYQVNPLLVDETQGALFEKVFPGPEERLFLPE